MKHFRPPGNEDAPLGIAIVGGGFTGYAAAIALARRIGRPMEIAIIDANSSRGGGVAYGRAGPSHILNVRAWELTCDADRPGDFVAWLRDERSVSPPAATLLRQLFMPRRQVADYMASRLVEASRDSHLARLWLYDETVRRITWSRRGYVLHFGPFSSVEAQIVILAAGYGPRTRPRFGLDPFTPLKPGRIERARSVAVVGAGLTMVDACVTLRRAGYEGMITVLSRHGMIPEAHAGDAVPDFPSFAREEPDLLSLFRTVRQFVALARKQALPWQSVINAVRRDAQHIWQRLSEADKRRFQRHVRPVWDKLRHRVPLQVRNWLDSEIDEGLIALKAARVVEVSKAGPDWGVSWRPRGSAHTLNARFDLVFDCTGHAPWRPGGALRELENYGWIGPGPGGLGVKVAADGAVIGVDGVPTKGLFALGPMGQGSLLEITAAPEIVAQARLCAQRIARDFNCPKRALDLREDPRAS